MSDQFNAPGAGLDTSVSDANPPRETSSGDPPTIGFLQRLRAGVSAPGDLVAVLSFVISAALSFCAIRARARARTWSHSGGKRDV